jgi:hypothetical protein
MNNNISIDFIMTGEKFQKKSKLYIAHTFEFFYSNSSTINDNVQKLLLSSINNYFDNPDIVFFQADCLKELSNKIMFFKNNFILISGNSDENIYNNEYYLNLLNNSKIIKWYGQNNCIDHPKMFSLPIGLANKQWQHGNIDEFVKIINKLPEKINNVYFNFQIQTNYNKRIVCYEEFKNYLLFLDTIDAVDNFKRLATYKFCICPEGNGLDSHRIWECYYLKVVPIVLNNDFIQLIKKQYNIPMIILEEWKDLVNMSLNYDNFKNNFFYKKHEIMEL